MKQDSQILLVCIRNKPSIVFLTSKKKKKEKRGEGRHIDVFNVPMQNNIHDSEIVEKKNLVKRRLCVIKTV